MDQTPVTRYEMLGCTPDPHLTSDGSWFPSRIKASLGGSARGDALGEVCCQNFMCQRVGMKVKLVQPIFRGLFGLAW